MDHSSSSTLDADIPRAYVEFVHRIHSDGRRERFARVMELDADGNPVPGPRRPTGALGAFVAGAVREHAAFRRVPIDPRAAFGRRGR